MRPLALYWSLDIFTQRIRTALSQCPAFAIIGPYTWNGLPPLLRTEQGWIFDRGFLRYSCIVRNNNFTATVTVNEIILFSLTTTLGAVIVNYFCLIYTLQSTCLVPFLKLVIISTCINRAFQPQLGRGRLWVSILNWSYFKFILNVWWVQFLSYNYPHRKGNQKLGLRSY